MPVFINEVNIEANAQAQSGTAETVALPGADEQAEKVLRLLEIQQERQARLRVD